MYYPYWQLGGTPWYQPPVQQQAPPYFQLPPLYTGPYSSPYQTSLVPYLTRPLRTPETPQDRTRTIMRDLMTAIDGEHRAIQCYQQMAQHAPTKKEQQQIEEIITDEQRHLRTFSALYQQITEKQHEPTTDQKISHNYEKALAFAVEEEQKTVDFYLEVADHAPNLQIREAFQRAAKDEQNHAVWFLYFLTKRLTSKL
ncbi:ferritin family protein [Halalkalibacterium halodurans]|uniref:BH1034 protein n=2 Tax=Halalkalibacterium halodurans TaxID=86665 RepID=Q9KE24_HALH5|nr:ferritin family protein [Halalkalibacterium halodurans]MDY7221570.1 ferritin family protein [Halalkalibacterium halodurans]MDY7240846.1 ferritin family protein [Halalkalibacterium halodurans]MED3647373.1 ferritin family protein [Halalkalibacterium halodurans]MED4080501.1 ferritin family protein [Halalkalibacterium halodurans]MED4086486.1 ferritin family protein [Halalkalibacterium halodurans]